MQRILGVAALCGLAMIGLSAALAAQSTIEKKAAGRVFVLGFDGLDYELARKLLDAGKLPHLSALAKKGVFAPLSPTMPAQSPVAWSAITTGKNPGETGIDDFLVRDFSHGDVRADLGLVKVTTNREGLLDRRKRRHAILIFSGVFVAVLIVMSQKASSASIRRTGAALGVLSAALGITAAYFAETALPDGAPKLENARRGEAYWETLDKKKERTVTVLAPCAFPAPHLDGGHLLCGLGVPDALGSPGTWSHYSTAIEKIQSTETGGWRIPLEYVDPARANGLLKDTIVIGPKNMVRDDKKRVIGAAKVSVDQGTQRVTFTAQNTVTVEKGRWSEPVSFEYVHSPLVATKSVSRLKFLDTPDALSLYLDAPGFDPEFLPPVIKLSEPTEWGAALKKAVGAYETVGWACATNALKDGAIDETTFYEDAMRVWDEQEKLARAGLAIGSSRVYTTIFTVPDRMQHMFAGTSAFGESAKSPEMRDVITEVYLRVDRFVGEVMEKHAKPDDLVLVVSDHGFSEWKRAVNLNTFLVEKGYLRLTGSTGSRSLETDLANGHAYSSVDWSKTKAYSLGLGRIYLNRRGREPFGIVGDDEAKSLIAEIRRQLMDLKDGGESAVSRAESGSDIYRGDAIPNGAADVYVSFHRGWRVSWASCLGGADEPVFSDNKSSWRGDHCSVDPELVRGVFFADRPITVERPRAVDIAPTVLDFCGVATAPSHELNGKSLLVR